MSQQSSDQPAGHSVERATEKLVDVEKVIPKKKPKLLKLLPGFIIRYIKRTIHQDELNQAVKRNENRFGHDFVDAAMEEFGAKTAIIGIENIPTQGGVIMAANHPLGGLDGIAFMDVVGNRRKDIKFFVNDILLELKNFAPIFVPVNKHGKNSADYTKKFEEIYSSSECLLIFPAGLVSRREEGHVVKDLVWKKSFITKAVQYQKNVIPVYIGGHNSKFFYNLAYWRKKIGIKANIEMLFLPDEMFKQKGQTIRVHFSKAFDPAILDKSKTHKGWTDFIKKFIYSEEFKKGVSFEEYIKL